MLNEKKHKSWWKKAKLQVLKKLSKKPSTLKYDQQSQKNIIDVDKHAVDKVTEIQSKKVLFNVQKVRKNNVKLICYFFFCFFFFEILITICT